MHPIPRIFLICATTITLAFDAYAFVSRMHEDSAPEVAWLKVAGAFLLQSAVLLVALGYLKFVGKRPRLELPPYGSFDSWQRRYMPVAILVVAAGFAGTLLYNGVLCGDRPLPSGRGVSVCSK